MDMDTCSEGEGVRDLGEEDVLASPPPSTPPGALLAPSLGTPMLVDQPQSPLSPVTSMIGNTQLDISYEDTSINLVKREPSQK